MELNFIFFKCNEIARLVQLQDPLCEIVAMFWMVFQPLLFGLIGAEVNISQIDGGTVGMWK